MNKREDPTLLKILFPSLKNIFWLAIFYGVLALGPSMMNIDGDLGRHITIGNAILSSGSIPTSDIFSHTMTGEPLTPHEWLAQVIFAAAHRVMGLDGVVLITALTIATAFGFVLHLAVRRSGSLLGGLAITILSGGAASLHWLTRPHIFTFLFLGIWMVVLEDIRVGKPWRWIGMPLLMLLWANLHGAFIAGFVVWILVLGGLAWEKWMEKSTPEYPRSYYRNLLLGGALSFAATIINPAGLGLWRTSLGYLGSQYLVGHTEEYLSPNFHSSSTWPFLLMILLLLGLLGIRKQRSSPVDLMLAGAWLLMGLISARNIPLFAIISAPFLSVCFADAVKNQSIRSGWFGKLTTLDSRIAAVEGLVNGRLWPILGIAAAGILLANGVNLDFNQQGNRFDPRVFPVQALDWLVEHPQNGEMFNYFPWGGYILYRDWPEKRVFIDGQTDFYGESLTRDYERVLTLQDNWRSVLSDNHVNWVIWPADGMLVDELANDPAWNQVYQDETSEIFVRR